ADLAASWNNGGTLSTAVYLSDGSRFPGWSQWSNSDGGWIDAPSQKWVAGDFNGDRKADIAAIWNDGGTNTITVSQSTGSSFTRRHWATHAGGWADSTAWLAGDFNNDGKADLAASWNSGS
ncbi:VCBS repeat-containing protein, partial [Streptosporangium sp. NPDC020072]|uniref:FG-GAP repeat domain-containing protein n=2 Tax=unclassified Streptosporangium TaxID=2632669 RepID=UPI00342F2A0D